MNKQIEEMIENGRAIVHEREYAAEVEASLRYYDEYSLRLSLWDEVFRDIAVKIPGVLHEYIHAPIAPSDETTPFEQRLMISIPMPYGEDVALKVPGLRDVLIRVIKQGSVWIIERFDVDAFPKGFNEYRHSSAKRKACTTLDEALYQAKIAHEKDEQEKAIKDTLIEAKEEADVAKDAEKVEIPLEHIMLYINDSISQMNIRNSSLYEIVLSMSLSAIAKILYERRGDW